MENNNFNELFKQFKELSIDYKKEIAMNEIKEVITLMNRLNEDLNINSDNLLINQISDSVNTNEDDYVDAMFIYINQIKESLGAYLDKITDILYENKQE